MKIEAEDIYKTYIIVKDGHNNKIYEGNAFDLVKDDLGSIKIFLKDVYYDVMNLENDYYLIVSKNSYYLINNEQMENILLASYKEKDNKKFHDFNIQKFLEIYFENEMYNIDVYFEDDSNLKEINGCKVSSEDKGLLILRAECDENIIYLKYNNKKIVISKLKHL